MKDFHVFDVYLDDGDHAYKVTVPAENKTSAIKYTEGNGEVIAVKEKDIKLSTYKLAQDLKCSGWGQAEIDTLTRLVYQVGLALD